MNTHHILAIIVKQIKDSFRNKMVILVFFMFPILALIFSKILSNNELQSIIPSFSTMNTVMMPIIFMSSIVAEEKEKGSLRMLVMSNITPFEYLTGIGISVFLLSLLSTILFLFFYDISAKETIIFVCMASIGIILSMIVGGIIALIGKNQMSVGPLSAPIAMILGLLPMFSTMNSDIKNVAYFLYTYHIRKGLLSFEFPDTVKPYIVVLINLFILIFVFFIVYHYKGIKDE